MMRLASRLQHIEPFYVMECAKAAGEIARFVDHRARGGLDRHSHRLAQDEGQGGLAKAGGAGEQHVV